MSRHDLLLSVRRHATSKIERWEDLQSLRTMGFRGEALPSIAAVSHTRITTSDGEEGWKLSMDGGILKDVQPAARSRGTTVEVTGIFYNQPPRRKFLRSEATELSWVNTFVTGCSLSRTDVSFSLSHNQRKLFDLPGGQKVAERMVSRFDLSPDSPRVEGRGTAGGTEAYVLLFPDQRWSHNRHQYLLVNGRLIYSRLVRDILRNRIGGPAGHPLVLCDLRLRSLDLDVNAHPTKRQVRFRKPGEVESAMEQALMDCTGGRKAEFRKPASFPAYIGTRRTAAPDTDVFQTAMELQEPSGRRLAGTEARPPDAEIVQIAKSYLVAEIESGLVIVDQHAAHERILFENVLAHVRRAGAVGSQILLLPEVIGLDPEQLEILRQCDVLLRKAGYQFELDGEKVVLTAVPEGVSHAPDALMEVLRTVGSPGRATRPEYEQIAAATACAGAIKAGDRLSAEEARKLVEASGCQFRPPFTDLPIRAPFAKKISLLFRIP
jgi:DNA mismatch repair protein MutL